MLSAGSILAMAGIATGAWLALARELRRAEAAPAAPATAQTR
jgi:hypothetical protein